MLEFPNALERLIQNRLKDFYLKKPNTPFGQKDYLYFSKGAERLSEAFTTERSTLKPNYLSDPVLASGYLLYFLPVNFLKVVRILKEWKTPPTGTLRMLDIGCGPGTSFLGAMHFFAPLSVKNPIHLEIVAVDQNSQMLGHARHFHQVWLTELQKKYKNFTSTLKTESKPIRPGKGMDASGLFDLIVTSNFLNEFDSRDEQRQIIEGWIEYLLKPATGTLIVIEPATKKSSRDVQALRDTIVFEKQLMHVHSPCLHAHQCPLNMVNKRDWCHFYLSWKRPEIIEKTDKMIGNRKSFLACSYLLLSHQPAPTFATNNWRVISNVLPSNGKKEVVLCGPTGRTHLTRLDRFRSASNYKFDEVKRGNLISTSLPKSARYDADARGSLESKDEIDILDSL